MAVLGGFIFEALGVTREEVVQAMDDFAFTCLESVGGQPWLCVDDDTQKVVATTAVKDEQGFCYQGRRKYVFQGPVADHLPGVIYHDGFKCQGREEL